MALVATGLPAASAGMASAHEAKHRVHTQPKGDGGWKGTRAPKPSPFSWTPPAGRGTHLVKTDPHAKRVKELTGRRTADAGFFQMSDGSVQEEVSAVPVHYRDKKGVWRDIDVAVQPLAHDGYTAGSLGNAFRTYFSSNASRVVRIEQGSGSVQLGADGATLSKPEVSGNRVTYPGAYPGADLSYRTGPSGVKESIVLAKPPTAGESFAFSLKVTGFTPRQLADGAIAFYGGEADTPAFTIPAPYMSDAEADVNSPYGKAYSSEVKQTMAWDARAGVLRLSLTPDAAWLADPHRRYPVTIDPTILVAPTPSQAANVMILADGASTNYANSSRLSVGTTTTGAARTLIRFPMPSVPAGTTITSADLKLYYDQTFTTGSHNVPMQVLAADAAWNPATATWNNARSIGGPVAGTASTEANALGVWNDFPVTSTVQDWLGGASANNGFVLKAADEGTLGQGGPRYEGSVYAYGGEAVNYPKLVITYGVPGVSLNRPSVIHSTGAELSWPAYTNTTGDSGNDLAGYEVHRGIHQTFTPSASTEIAPVKPGTTGFADSAAVPTAADNPDPYGNAYYYMVVVRTKSGALIPGPTQLVRLPKAGRTTLVVPAQSAATLSSAKPGTVLGTLDNSGTAEPWLEVGDSSGTYGAARSVLNFSALSAVPAGSTVLDAHLKLWQESTTTATSGAAYELHALTRPFTGAQATWNSAATATAWTKPGGDFTAAAAGTVSGLTNDPHRQTLDATSIVQGWINSPSTNDGLLVKLADESAGAPQERTVFAGPNTAEPGLAPALVVTYLDRSTESTYYAPATPSAIAPGTTYSVPVTVNNTTGSPWTAADEVLTYHWTLPDGTDVTTADNQLRTGLPADLAPGDTVTLNAQVTPPKVSDGNQDEGVTLAWDMYDSSTGTYLSTGSGAASPMRRTAATSAAVGTTASGIGSLKQQVSVDPSGNNQLGLEKFYAYATTPTGSGSALYSNEASGNTVWSDDLFGNPSVGFDTTLRLSYNSMSTMDTTTGFGWSVQASAPVRLGQALQFHPPTKPTSMVMVDGTGNAHQWTLTTDTTTHITTGTPPPGVHLLLQGTACKPQDTNARAWRMTRPDRTTYYFDCEGYPTAQVDANGNEADFSYTARQSQNQPEEFLDHISDPLHNQTLTLAYYNKGDDFSYIDSTGALVSGTNLTDPAIIDHVRSITDVSGRTVDFYYTGQGLLGRFVDGAGSGVAKTFNFTYDATQGMKNVKLVAVQDPRGNSTKLAYYPNSSSTKWWTQTVTDRDGYATGFAYAQPGTVSGAATSSTVTDPNGGKWVHETDSAGRPIQEVAPAPTAGAQVRTTTLKWDDDNNVTDLTEDNGAHNEWSYDQNTGYPTSYKDALAVKNGTAATTYTYATTDSADPALSGHIAFLTDRTSPQGRRTHYTYYPLSPGDAGYVATAGYAGNLETVQAPGGTAANAPVNSYLTTYTYDIYGQLASVKDANGHTSFYVNSHTLPDSSTQFPEPTGQPDSVTDAAGNTTTFSYGSRGEVKSTTDPLGHTATADYDVFLRQLGSRIPKDTASGTAITYPAPVYDGDNDVLQSTSATGGVTTHVYDADGRVTSTTLPPDGSPLNPPRTITYGYDKVGNKTTTVSPLGNVPGGTQANYTTTVGYDAENQATSVTDALKQPTVIGFDDVGNKTSVTDPAGNLTTFAFDQDHRPTGTTDAQKYTTSIGYDLDGLKTSTTDQNGSTDNYTLDPDGQVTQVAVLHASNGSTSFAYNTTQYTYDQVGNNTSVVSPQGVVSAANGVAGAYTAYTQYDADNRVSRKLGAILPGDANYGAAEQPVTDYSYTPDGKLSTLTRTTVTPYPGTNAQPTTSIATTSYAYFDNGWTRSITDPFGIRTAYDYDTSGRQVSRTLTPAENTTQRKMSWSYFPDGSTQSFTDTGVGAGWQDQVITSTGPNAQNTLNWTQADSGYQGEKYFVSKNTSNPVTWNFTVPQQGTYSIKVFVPNNSSLNGVKSASYTVNYNGTPVKSDITVTQSSNQGTWVTLGTDFSFGAAGTTGSVVLTPLGESVVAADAVELVRNTDESQPNPTWFTYDYDADGNTVGITDISPNAAFSNYTKTYDHLDRLKQVQETSGSTVVHTIGYDYDADSNVTGQTTDARIDSYTYDPLNRLKQVINQQSLSDPGLTTGYTYTPVGERATQTKPNGNKVSYGYNLDGTLRSSSEVTGSGTTVDTHQLAYDANNNIVSDQLTLQRGSGAPPLNRTVNRTYSPNNQVTGVTNDPDGKFNQSYTYDSAGNIVDETANGGPQTFYTYDRGRLIQSDTSGAYQYDTLGRLTEIANGNFTGYVGTAAQKNVYDGYDNILSSSSTRTDPKTNTPTTNTTQYAYDSMNRATSETLNAGSATAQTSKFDYLGTSNVVLDEHGTGYIAADKVYNYSPTGERLEMTNTYTAGGPGATTDNYYTYNSHGDVEALTDTSGSANATYGYTAYGSDADTGDGNTPDSGPDQPTTPPTPTATLPFNAYRFNAARVDVSSSNLNMGARSYDPNINRFLTRDTFNGAGADAGVSALGSPYGFAGGNPISNVEMNGHGWKTWLGVGLVVAAVTGAVVCTVATVGGCLVAIGTAAAEGAAFGAEASVGAAAVASIAEGVGATAAVLGAEDAAVTVGAGALAAGTTAVVEESVAADVGAVEASASSAAADEQAAAAADEIPAGVYRGAPKGRPAYYKDGPIVSLNRFRMAMGRAGLIDDVDKYELQYDPEYTTSDGRPAFGDSPMTINPKTLRYAPVRGESGRPIIRFANLGLQSVQESVTTFYHEVYHQEIIAATKGAEKGLEDEAEAYGQAMWEKLKSRF
ncbi:DNRLRE domain-containing protein [Streptomyces sp. BR1]|uniref:DNRLRE domain-containing protein n=1 Tax=Streptomyces sp. BR1 TaxID=1592323 RepID=UPI00402B108B